MSMKVPLLDLKAQYAGIRPEVDKAIADVLESQQFIMGPQVAQFEQAVARYIGARHTIGMSSGTDALLAALMALDVRPGDAIITSTYSFFATAGVAARLGATTILVDIDPGSYNVTAAGIEKAWSKLDPARRRRVKAIVPVHLFGRCAEMAPIAELGDRIGVPVIEDAAQAIGCLTSDDRNAGTVGLIGCFSFFPSKNLGAIGDAGMAVTNDDAVGERLRLLRNHGAKPKYYHKLVGGNFRLDTIQAAVLQVKLAHLAKWTAARREHAAHYRRLFKDRRLTDRVGLPEAPPDDADHVKHIYNQFVIRVARREALRQFLTTRGIGTEVYYPVPFHMQECFRDLGYREGDFPEAERAARETLALPIYPELSSDQQAYVVDTVVEFFRSVGE
jgi:dTDP-4-amino-4,6-dideoxygalactose transaminase